MQLILQEGKQRGQVFFGKVLTGQLARQLVLGRYQLATTIKLPGGWVVGGWWWWWRHWPDRQMGHVGAGGLVQPRGGEFPEPFHVGLGPCSKTMPVLAAARSVLWGLVDFQKFSK